MQEAAERRASAKRAVVLNAAGSATEVSYALQNTGITTGTATPYLTNGSNSMTAGVTIANTGSSRSTAGR
ncbi:hypothetical protein [Nonomuraea sp. NPDC049400]|uniref:hypothetical protein n=1 Tax=Nonomuraea sp. NPDC049400 TaxID=3364352 RepID=UPI0037A53C62